MVKNSHVQIRVKGKVKRESSLIIIRAKLNSLKHMTLAVGCLY